VVLFTGVVVTLVTVVAVTGVFPLVTADGAPSTAIEADLTTTTLTVTHAGGEPLDAEDVTVIVRDAGGERRVDADTVVTGVISPGDTLSVPASLSPGDRRRVLVVHEPSNTLLFEGRQVARLAPGTGSVLRWTRPVDWDTATTETGVVHDDFGDHAAGRLDLGYPRGNPGDRWGVTPRVYYPLDGDSGPAVDVTNGEDATVSGATPGADGVFGTSAYSFDGSEDAIEDADGERYINGLTEFTVSVWVKPSPDTVGSNRGVLFADDPNDKDNRLGLRYDSAGFENGCTDCIKAGLQVGGDEMVLESSSNVHTDDWQHLVITWSSGDPMQLYIDGVEDSPSYTEARSGQVTGASKLLLGQGSQDFGGNDGWEGRIEEFRLYDQELTDTQVRALYDASRRGSLTTNPQALADPATANNLTLQNVDATPDGGSVEVVVKADVDGDGSYGEAAGQRSDPITLTASQDSYDVDGFTTGATADSYRLVFELTATAPTQGPSVGRVDLVPAST